MSDADEGALGSTILEQTQQGGGISDTAGLRSGDVVGRYRLIAQLGSGAMGVVWSALDPNLDRAVALKVVHPRLASSPEASARMLREARALAKVSHHAVVGVYDAAEIDDRLFIAMELVEGTTLGAMLRQRAPADLEDWRRWLALTLEAGRGLAAAHRAGILHRDFKPDNVLVDAAGKPRVADFGLASLGSVAPESGELPRASVQALGLTVTGTLLGTPLYMSPQQLRGESIDARADQFAFCVACWEAVYGARPFAITMTGWAAVSELAEKIEAGTPIDSPPASTVPVALRGILMRGLRADPAERFPTMDALVAALTKAAAPRRLGRRLRWIAGSALVAALAAIGGWSLRSHRAAPPNARALFPASIRTLLALSPDGSHLALGADRLEVRALPFDESRAVPPPTLEFADGDQISSIQLDAQGAIYSKILNGVYRWDYASGHAPVRLDVPEGIWQGRVGDTDVVVRKEAGVEVLIAVRAGRELARWSLSARPELFAASPDGKRFAILESHRFDGWIDVGNVETGTLIRSPLLVEPTAVTWQSSSSLVYTTGALIEPTIWKVDVADDHFGSAAAVFHHERGWFMQIVARGSQMLFIEAMPSTRTRMLTRGTSATAHDFDATVVAAPIGWEASGAFVAWNQSTRSIERHLGATSTVIASGFPEEPINATVSGDVAIIAVRARGGRDIIAVSLTTGARLWTKPAGQLLAVRCADDRMEPCYALRATVEPHYEVVRIDPHTGIASGAALAVGDAVEDIAVRGDGQRIAVAGLGKVTHEVDLQGNETIMNEAKLGNTRSVAYDPTGGLLVAGTRRGYTFEVGHLDAAAYTVITTSESAFLSLVRPSSDGATLLVLTRAYSPALWQLDLGN